MNTLRLMAPVLAALSGSLILSLSPRRITRCEPAGGRAKVSVTIETNVEKLSDEEVQQVSAYLQGL